MKTKMLFLSIRSDALFPAARVRQLAEAVHQAGGNATYQELDSPHGHDAFLNDGYKARKAQPMSMESSQNHFKSVSEQEEQALQGLLQSPFVDALFERRSRRFSRGSSISERSLASPSKHEAVPLTELETLLILTAVGGNTVWHHSITRHERYPSHLSHYPGRVSGRTFPSAAGFRSSEVFFTDDSGTYTFTTRDAPTPVQYEPNGPFPLTEFIKAHRSRIHKLSDQRLSIPLKELYMEGHTIRVANRPGSFLIIPMGDVAQHAIANLCFFTQNGRGIFDDIHHQRIPGLEKFADIVDVKNPLPLTFLDQYSLTACTEELSIATDAGVLMQQAIGLGGGMFHGIDRLTILGASGDPKIPGLGFRYDTDERWASPNPTGLTDVFEGHTPPHYHTLRAAVDHFCEHKLSTGGSFHTDTPGLWKENYKARASEQVYDEKFRDCVALQAQYAFDTFGKFPATVPTILVLMYLQSHHLDYHDTLFESGTSLQTHARHLATWHAGVA